MSRDLPEPLEAAIDEPVVRPFLALHIDLPDVVRVWTGVGTITFPDADEVSREWLGAGGVGQLDAIGEATDGSATGMKATLFNVPAEFRDDIADQAVKGVAFEVYVGALNETYQQVEGSKPIWKGRLDDYRITDAGTTITVEVMGEIRGIDQRRPSIKRMTDEWQQRKHPGDRFFEYVSRMAEVPIFWAQAEQQATVAGGSGGYGAGGGGSNYGTVHYL